MNVFGLDEKLPRVLNVIELRCRLCMNLGLMVELFGFEGNSPCDKTGIM